MTWTGGAVCPSAAASRAGSESCIKGVGKIDGPSTEGAAAVAPISGEGASLIGRGPGKLASRAGAAIGPNGEIDPPGAASAAATDHGGAAPRSPERRRGHASAK